MVLRTHSDLVAFGWQDGLGKAVKLWVVSTALGNNTVTLTLYEFTGLYMRNAMTPATPDVFLNHLRAPTVMAY